MKNITNTECDDYQLCPYQNCCWKCGLHHETGWYICPNCGREFWAEISESDYEDYGCFYENDGFDHEPPPKPQKIDIAGDCGVSWATPEGNPAKVK